MKYLILLCCLFTGCASAGMNGFCGRITGSELTVPYIGGKTNADGYICHVGCVGMNCPKPDYDAITSIMTSYLKAQTTDGKLTVTGPGTVSFTPTK